MLALNPFNFGAAGHGQFTDWAPRMLRGLYPYFSDRLVIKNAKVKILNGYIKILCDEDTYIFKEKCFKTEEYKQINFSRIKLNSSINLF